MKNLDISHNSQNFIITFQLAKVNRNDRLELVEQTYKIYYWRAEEEGIIKNDLIFHSEY